MWAQMEGAGTAKCDSYFQGQFSDASVPVQIQVEGVQHYLGVFESEQLALAEYNQRANSLGRFACGPGGPSGSSDVSSCESDDSRLLVAKVLLGKRIRDLAEANYQLASALATGASQQQIAELACKVEQLLKLQDSCLCEINSLA